MQPLSFVLAVLKEHWARVCNKRVIIVLHAIKHRPAQGVQTVLVDPGELPEQVLKDSGALRGCLRCILARFGAGGRV